MRLKKIEVCGFKSFADRQVVVVDDHVTAVIGPNGCGKSNIVDAMRWCMGEQSAKHLRGAGMADVIFAGCSTRGPAGMAEVTLTFDNTGGNAPPHLEMPEIGITRRLFADGTSEYLINKVPGRLRDITELLMGTGAGTKGYSIIEQGQVGKIVSSKPEERRHIIDEAAGITRFKSQKAAAERKIEATRQNLLRVTDIVAELEGRLTTLRRQAQKAARYKRYREEMRDLELWIASHKYLELATTGRVLAERRESMAQQVSDLRAAIGARDAQIEAKRLAITEVERELSEHQQQVYDLDNRVKLSEAEEEYRRREREGLISSAAQSRAETEAAQRGLTRLAEELAQVQSELDALGAAGPDGGHGVVDGLTTELADVARRLEACVHSQDAERLQLARATEQAAAGTARREGLAERSAEVAAQLEALASALVELHAQAQGSVEQRERATAAVESAHASLDGLRQRKAALDRQRADLRAHVSAGEVELDTTRAEVHRCRSRLQSLQDIQRRYRGCQSGVQVVMEHRDELMSGASVSTDGSVSGTARPPAVIGVLADYLDSPPHLEPAVSAVLGDALQGIVVDEPGAAARGVDLLKRLKEGRTTFLPKTAQRSVPAVAAREREPMAPQSATLGWADPPREGGGRIEVVDLSDAPAAASPGAAILAEAGVVGRLRDLVSLGGDLRELADVLLGDTIVVDDLAVALELSRRFAQRPSLVTLDGDRLEPSGIIVGGSATALDSALLKQKREITELEEILEEITAAFDAARARQLGLAGRLTDVESERESVEQAVLEAEKTNLAAAQALSQVEADAARLADALRTKTAEHEAAALRASAYARESAELSTALAVTALEVDGLAESLERAATQLQELAGARADVETRLTDAKVALARWQQKADAVAQTKDRLDRQARSERERIERLEQSASAADARAEALVARNAEAKVEREALVLASREATAKAHDARERFDSLRLGLDDVEASVKTLRADLDRDREVLQEVELGLQEIGLERAHVVQDVRRHFDTELSLVLIDFHNRAQAGAAERARQRELGRILSRMGEVNLTAIDEFEEVQERYTYLSGQREDLDKAIGQLQEAIDRINKTTRQLFREAFVAIDERFQQLFPRLFNGGRAQLRLTDPSDMLSTGVEIVAQPPGKQLRSLDLLSGGEKALTAVSLIFAVFLFKPSPFCILDEVDAPLDDANVARMNKLVRELAEGTQFVLITHNKVTMENSDRLYGVTMEQRGVSKLVSVNMRRAVELAYN